MVSWGQAIIVFLAVTDVHKNSIARTQCWLKILADTKMNPFAQLPIRSKRQLIVLTVDKFAEYNDRIANLDLSTAVMQSEVVKA
jgi:hypothetical protein